MPAQKPDPRRSPIPYTLQARLTKAQYAYLLLVAENAGSLGAALRQVIDRVIDGQTIWTGPEEHDVDTGEPLRPWLEQVDLDHIDAADIVLGDEE